MAAKFDSKTIEKYQDLLQKDPQSLVFAALAEAYWERGLQAEAIKLVQSGVQKHPKYVGGFLVWGRILLEKKDLEGAKKVLERAVQLSPENLLAYQLLAQTHFERKSMKEALKAHKMVLFLNPQNEKSRKFIEKLETMTADEYDAELFEMKPLASANLGEQTRTSVHPEKNVEKLERTVSFVDALIVRNELKKAEELLLDALNNYPDHEEITKRLRLLGASLEEAEPIQPEASRENEVVQRKIAILQNILHTLQSHPGSMG